MAAASAEPAEAADLRFAVAHDGKRIPIEIYGRGSRHLLLGPFTASVRSQRAVLETARRVFLDQLTDRYRVVLFDYPGEPKSDTLTPEAVARDYLAVADAAEADRFAYCGYSWGAVTGLQLAIRTDRLTALVSGGFPMIDGPYKEMLTMAQRLEATSPTPARFRQFITYYTALQKFDDRAAQPLITCPRLCFVGTHDDLVVNGEILGSISRNVIGNAAALEGLGWDLKLLEGKDHRAASAADIVAPLLRQWLDSSWPEAARAS